MRILKMSIVNAGGDILDLPLQNPAGGFVVKEIEGLGPVKAEIVSAGFASFDGQRVQSARRGSRNLVIRLALDPDYSSVSVYDLRRELYRYLMPKRKCTIKFNLFDRFDGDVTTQYLDVEIDGRVESIEPSIFTSEPAVDISILCDYPDFQNTELHQFDGVTVSDLTEVLLDYKGSSETGALFELNVDRVLSDFTVYQRTPDGVLRAMYFTEELNNGDLLTINSNFGAKSVTKLSAGVESSVVYGLSPQSTWLELQPGENYIRVYAIGDPVPFSIKYNDKYGGL